MTWIGRADLEYSPRAEGGALVESATLLLATTSATDTALMNLGRRGCKQTTSASSGVFHCSTGRYEKNEMHEMERCMFCIAIAAVSGCAGPCSHDRHRLLTTTSTSTVSDADSKALSRVHRLFVCLSVFDTITSAHHNSAP
jgi:hypothetical protein